MLQTDFICRKVGQWNLAWLDNKHTRGSKVVKKVNQVEAPYHIEVCPPPLPR